jgi:hypothetical protein
VATVVWRRVVFMAFLALCAVAAFYLSRYGM